MTLHDDSKLPVNSGTGPRSLSLRACFKLSVPAQLQKQSEPAAVPQCHLALALPITAATGWRWPVGRRLLPIGKVLPHLSDFSLGKVGTRILHLSETRLSEMLCLPRFQISTTPGLSSHHVPKPNQTTEVDISPIVKSCGAAPFGIPHHTTV